MSYIRLVFLCCVWVLTSGDRVTWIRPNSVVIQHPGLPQRIHASFRRKNCLWKKKSRWWSQRLFPKRMWVACLRVVYWVWRLCFLEFSFPNNFYISGQQSCSSHPQLVRAIVTVIRITDRLQLRSLGKLVFLGRGSVVF